MFNGRGPSINLTLFMKKTLFILLLFCISLLNAQDQQINLSEKIKNDPSVIKGKLENGFTYYIKTNKKPEKRAEFRLVVNAGAIDEDDDQNLLPIYHPRSLAVQY